MPEYGACFDKLPISAFIDWDSDKPDGPGVIENDLPLSDLQYLKRNVFLNHRFSPELSRPEPDWLKLCWQMSSALDPFAKLN